MGNPHLGGFPPRRGVKPCFYRTPLRAVLALWPDPLQLWLAFFRILSCLPDFSQVASQSIIPQGQGCQLAFTYSFVCLFAYYNHVSLGILVYILFLLLKTLQGRFKRLLEVSGVLLLFSVASP